MLRHYIKSIDSKNYLYVQKGTDFYRIDYKYANKVEQLYSAHLINNSYVNDNWISYKSTEGYTTHINKFIFETITKKEFVKEVI